MKMHKDFIVVKRDKVLNNLKEAKHEAEGYYSSRFYHGLQVIFEDINGTQYYFIVGRGNRLCVNTHKIMQAHEGKIGDRLQFLTGKATKKYWNLISRKGNSEWFYDCFNSLVTGLRKYKDIDVTTKAKYLFKFCKFTKHPYYPLDRLKLFFIDSHIELTRHEDDRYRVYGKEPLEALKNDAQFLPRQQ
jgi:hypothetical protein